MPSRARVSYAELKETASGVEFVDVTSQQRAPQLEGCYTNFETADWGAPASVRFGVLDLAGNFSGWSEPVSIEFPTEVTDYPVAREPDVAHEPHDYTRVNSVSCSTTHYGASSKTSTALLLLATAGLMRRARSRLTRP